MAALAIGCGCGSRRPPATGGHGDAGDAGPAAVADAAIDAAPRAGTEAAYRVIAVDDTSGGHLDVSVVWPTAGAAVRRSPGRTPCGTPRAPRARIATLHGVAGAVVIVDIAAGKAPPPAGDVRVTLRDCALVPAIVLAPGLGGALEVQSQDEAPRHVTATALGPAWRAEPLRAPLAAANLPAMGHTVAVALDDAGAIELAADGADPAYAIAPPHPYVAITDDSGAAGFDHLPAGTYPVRAWLPPAAGQPAIAATGTATIAAGADAALTLTLAP